MKHNKFDSFEILLNCQSLVPNISGFLELTSLDIELCLREILALFSIRNKSYNWPMKLLFNSLQIEHFLIRNGTQLKKQKFSILPSISGSQCNKWIPETPCKRLLRYILFVNQHFLYVIGKIKESCISGFTCDLNLYTWAQSHCYISNIGLA